MKKPELEIVHIDNNIITNSTGCVTKETECTVHTCNLECVGYCEPECAAAGTDT